MLHTRLQPRHASPLRRVVAEVNDPFARLAVEYDGITSAFRNTPPDFLPFAVWQYGLGELPPYLPDLYDLISEGIRWQRVRGTPGSIRRGLGWIGYDATLDEAPTRRRLWNKLQLHLDRVRDEDLPDLARMDGIVSLSLPVRSRFTRGYHGYDVRCAETSYKRFSGSIIGDDSGVYLPGIGAKWSFGRTYTARYDISAGELVALDAWIAPVEDWGSWSEIDTAWSDLEIEWSLPAVQARRKSIAASLVGHSIYLRFLRADGSTIGYRRCVKHPVKVDPAGPYQVGAAVYSVDHDTPDAVLIRALTDFGDGAGETATALRLTFDPVLADDAKPGKLWIDPEEVSGGYDVGFIPVDIQLGSTVRERVTVLVGMDSPYGPYAVAIGDGKAMASSTSDLLATIW